jgi:hypothetical protein
MPIEYLFALGFITLAAMGLVTGIMLFINGAKADCDVLKRQTRMHSRDE